jgi:release factor glutamine methyltransferase
LKKDNLQDNLRFLKLVEKRLSRPGILSPANEAEDLVRHFARMDRISFFTGRGRVSSEAKESVQQTLRKRLEGMPLSYLLNEAHFFGRKFFVNANVLIPRPETEILAEETLKTLDRHYPSGSNTTRVLDIGTGSGCLAVSVSLQRPDCDITGLDICDRALDVARKNAARHGRQDKIRFIKSDLFGALKKMAVWDIIITNPPYIADREIASLSREVRSEPRRALSGGADGLEIITAILELAPKYLKQGGFLLMEIGKGQSGVLRRRWSAWKEYKHLSFVKDLTGIERVLTVQKR